MRKVVVTAAALALAASIGCGGNADKGANRGLDKPKPAKQEVKKTEPAK